MFGIDYEISIVRFLNKTKIPQSTARILLEEDTQNRMDIIHTYD